MGQEDGPQNELEPGEIVGGEARRLLRNPKKEVKRLHSVAAEGESGATPLIEFGVLLRWLIPIALVVGGIVIGVYYGTR